MRAKASSPVDIDSGATFVSFRRFHIQLDEELEPHYIDGWRIWTVYNGTSSTTQVNVTASAEEPAYMFSFADSSLDFTNCCYFVDKFNAPKFYDGGCGGTGANSRHEDWKFFPDSVFDFYPLIEKVDKRLDGQ